MKYMLLIYGDESGWANMAQDDLNKMYAAYGAFSEELAKSGAMIDGSELHPTSTATTVRVRNGKTQTVDGPFAETKEQLGGYYLINVPNMDAAIKWAAKIPTAQNGSIEIRPLTENNTDTVKE
jgi:hypothetical protein